MESFRRFHEQRVDSQNRFARACKSLTNFMREYPDVSTDELKKFIEFQMRFHQPSQVDRNAYKRVAAGLIEFKVSRGHKSVHDPSELNKSWALWVASHNSPQTPSDIERIRAAAAQGPPS